jgi:uncharacterized delta-60 repeat protein
VCGLVRPGSRRVSRPARSPLFARRPKPLRLSEHVLRSACLALMLLMAGTPVLRAQPGSVDLSFAPGGGNNGGFDSDVFAIAIQPDGQLVVGGHFTQVGRTPRNRVARLTPSGGLDPAFDTTAGPNGLVEVLALQVDGGVVIGGRFTAVAGQPRPYAARLTPSGSLDPAFDPQPDDIVLALALQPDGRVILGGAFTTVRGIPRPYLARLNPDGSIDPEFAVGAGPDAPVHTLALMPDGNLVVGGQFTSISGAARTHVARLHPDGSVDPAFDPGKGPNEPTIVSVAQPDGKVILGGYFTNVDGAERVYVARLNSNGRVDETFRPRLALANGGLNALRVEPDGKVVVGGQFAEVQGVMRPSLARLNADGSLDTSFDPGLGPFEPSGYPPLIRALALQADGNVLVGGRFTSFDEIRLNRIARLYGDSGGMVEFATNAVVADEKDGTALIPVRRTGDASGLVAVGCAVTGGTASPGTDYSLSSSTVVFAAGAGAETLSVRVTADSELEGDETIELTLGNPVGGVVLGSQVRLILTLRDSATTAVLRFVSAEPIGPDHLRLSLSTPSGQPVVLQDSVAGSPWSDHATNTPSQGVCTFLVAPGSQPGVRWFRAYTP